jgi:prepilin-type N-terminal cleavage/methylation domain-containing protein
MTARKQAGFTLIEVVVAMAILFGALVIGLDRVTTDVNSTNQAKLLSAAIGLARSKMFDLEEELAQKGFQEMTEDDEGDFSAEGFPAYKWKAKIEKVKIPSIGQLQTAQGKQGEKGAGSGEEVGSGLTGLMGAGGGNATAAAGASTIASQFELISGVLENSIRRVSLTVSWKVGRVHDEFTVTCYFTDPKAVDTALAPLNALAGAAGAGGAGGAGGTGGTGGPGGPR